MMFARGPRPTHKWRLVLLSVPVYINVITKEEQVQWAAHYANQLILQDHWAMARTTQQQCYEVVVGKNTVAENIGPVADNEGNQ